MAGLKLAIHGTGYPLPGEYDELPSESDKVELQLDILFRFF